MGEEGQSGFWERVSAGHTTVSIGQGGRVPAPPRGAWVARVRCDVPHRPLGPALDASERVASLVGEPTLGTAAAGLLRRGLRRRLLGEESGLDREGALLADLDRLADAGEGATALIFEAVDAADPATLDLLLHMVHKPLRPALILGFRSEPARGAARALLDAVIGVEGEQRVIRAVAPEPERPKSVDVRDLPTTVLRVLRAGVVIGECFEVELLGRLLGGIPAIYMLETIQQAADAGVPIDDLGDGRFRLDSATAESLRAGLLPSLASAWHRALASLLSDDDAPKAPDVDAPAPAISEPPITEPRLSRNLAYHFSTMAESASPAPDPFAGLATAPQPGQESPQEENTGVAPAVAPAASDDADPFASLAPSVQASEDSAPAVSPPVDAPALPPESDPFAALGTTGAPADEPVLPPFVRPQARPQPEVSRPAPPPDPVIWVAPGQEDPSQEDPAPRAPRPRVQVRAPAQAGRAAHHLAAAGEAEAAIPRFLEAARGALAQGAAASAESYLNKALALARMLPDTEPRRGLRAQAHLELARLHAEGGVGTHGLSLGEALAEAEEALALVGTEGTSALRAEIQTVIAACCYDIGDEASLTRALASLVSASHERMALGDARGAARLLNDQAAVWVRMGDPVRAAHLLTQSRDVFSSLAARRPEDAVELAETDHLLARLPLHVGARPGMEAAALEAALGHAAAAAEVYHALGHRRELARIWETVGRLELRRRSPTRARDNFTRAFLAAREEGDLIGMGSAAGGLAEVAIAEGQPAEALPLLTESIRLNLAKGSRRGLAANRAVLDTIGAALPEATRAPAVAETAALLAAAEGRLGVSA